MTGLDSVMLPVATINITGDLGAPVSGIQAAFALFSLTAAATYLTGGKLGDIYGRKQIYRTGLILYGLGIIAAMVAPNLLVLIAGWSILRGIGMGLLLPSVFGLILANYAGPRRAVAFGTIGAAAPSGAIVGPLLMGWMATNLHWRASFIIDLVLIVVVLLLTRLIGETARRPDAKLDWLGTALAALGIALLILGPTLASQQSAIGLPQVILISGAGIVALILLLLRCQRLTVQGKEPLFHLNLYKNRQFSAGWSTLLLFFFQMGAVVLTIPIFLQTVARFDALQSAYAMVPMFVGAALGSIASSRIIQRLSNRLFMQLSLVLVIAGLTWLRLIMSPGVEVGQLLLPMFILGLGFGSGLAQAPNIILSAVRPKEQGEAAGLNTTAQDIGIGLGAGVVGSLFLSQIMGDNTMQFVLLILMGVAALDFIAASLLPADTPD
jgi:MFS family permease